MVLVPFDIGVVYIITKNFVEQDTVLVPFDIGVVYITEWNVTENILVLVPFDIGVVYIQSLWQKLPQLRFSPLRYWGGLYHNTLD